ncbi:MAG: shikimate kinase [Armatimonadaceae bacterium]
MPGASLSNPTGFKVEKGLGSLDPGPFFLRYNTVMAAERTQDIAGPVLPGNVVLIGFMGCGKTTLGRLLAKRLDATFVDTDRLVESEFGPIPALFESRGEAFFRDRESEVIDRACTERGLVIATGGGAVLRPANCEAMRSSGLVIWLTARVDIIVSRTSRRRHSRPLLDVADPRERVLRLLGERSPLYRGCSHRIVDTSDRAPTSVVRHMVRLVEQWSHEVPPVDEVRQ